MREVILGFTVKETEDVWASQSGGVITKLGGTAGGTAYQRPWRCWGGHESSCSG
jgi:hypothetical protein